MKACDLVSLFKKIDDKIQVIVISSEVSLVLMKRLREARISCQAIKPVDLEEIKSEVECAFERIERGDLKKGFSLSSFQGGFRHEVERRVELTLGFLLWGICPFPFSWAYGRSCLER